MPRPRIAFVGGDPEDPRWAALRAGARQFADRLGLVEIDFLPAKTSRPEDQARLLSDQITADVSGVCIQVNDGGELLLPALKRLQNRGVQIVTMLRDVPQARRLGFVGLDQTSMGRLGAEALRELLPEGGSVMVLHAGRQHPIFGPRLAAFEDAMRRFANLRVSGHFDCGGDPTTAEAILTDKLTRFRPQAWLCLGDWPLEGVLAGRVRLPLGCPMIAYGAYPAYWPLLEDGRCAALIGAEDYRAIGEEAVRICTSGLMGDRNSRPMYLVPARIVRSGDLDAYKKKWPESTAALTQPSP